MITLYYVDKVNVTPTHHSHWHTHAHTHTQTHIIRHTTTQSDTDPSSDTGSQKRGGIKVLRGHKIPDSISNDGANKKVNQLWSDHISV